MASIARSGGTSQSVDLPPGHILPTATHRETTVSEEAKMKAEFLKQEGALPDSDTEESGQVVRRAFGVPTPELQGEMENAEPSTDEHADEPK